MKPQLLRVSMNLAQSFSARQDTVPYINNRWHYHAEVELIHFCENFWGEHFLDLPENKLIKTTLEKARRGIQIGDKIKTSVGETLNDIIHTEGPKKNHPAYGSADYHWQQLSAKPAFFNRFQA